MELNNNLGVKRTSEGLCIWITLYGQRVLAALTFKEARVLARAIEQELTDIDMTKKKEEQQLPKGGQ